MKKRKLNSKNPKYKTAAQIKAETKEVEKKIPIGVNGNKIYAVFYKQNTNTNG